MGDGQRGPDGRYTAEYADADFLDAVRAHEPAGTSEIADRVGCTTQNADYRLRQLEARGMITSKKIGGTLVWTCTTDSSPDDPGAAKPDSGSSNHRSAAMTFFDRVMNSHGDDILAGYVFGSVAHGTATPSSDVDVLVIVENNADYGSVDDAALDIAYDVQLQYGVPIEVHSFRERDFRTRMNRGDPFLRSALQEAEALAD